MSADTAQASATCLGLIILAIIFVFACVESAVGVSLVIAGGVLDKTVMWAISIPVLVIGIALIICSCFCCRRITG
jgi:hypothetical protein